MHPLKLEVRVMFVSSSCGYRFRYLNHESIIHAYALFNQGSERVRIPTDFIKTRYEEHYHTDEKVLHQIWCEIGAEREVYFDTVYQKIEETGLCLDQTGTVDDYLSKVGITVEIKDYTYVKAKDQTRPNVFQRSR